MKEENIKEYIVLKFTDLSRNFGIKGVTMDMVARDCGISKKTIYKYFKRKEDIIRDFINGILKFAMKEVEDIQSSGFDPLQQFDKMHELSMKIFSKVTMAQLNDIKTYYPEVNLLVEKVRENMDLFFLEKYKEGIASQLFRDIDPVFIHAFFRGAGDRVFDPDFILENNFTLKQVFQWFDILYKFGLLLKNN